MIEEYYMMWEDSGEMTYDLANNVYEQLDAIMEDGISSVDNLTQQHRPDDAFTAMIITTSLVNAAITKQPKIIRKLNKWIGKLKSSLQSLGKSIGADQISIAVGLPAGISVGLTWDI